MSTGRLESFSDGVLAVAITLLILNITIPDPATHPSLAHALGRQWPQYVAYAISFGTIGIIWVNHHVMIGRLRAVDHGVMFLNILLLMSVVLIPFATALMAEYLTGTQGQHLAAGIYGGSLLLMSVSFSALNHHILIRRPELLATEMSRGARRRLLLRSMSGLSPYALATALAVVSPYLTLALTGALALFYALPASRSVPN
jgi:uncharacterized membrane protein